MPAARLPQLIDTLTPWIEEAIDEVFTDFDVVYDTAYTITQTGPVFSIILFVEEPELGVIEVWSSSRAPSRLTKDEVTKVLQGLHQTVEQQMASAKGAVAAESNGHPHPH